ncbi:hypothetical protein AB0J72_16485 [Dactylosporangium sp. NPDC049742]|uniref:hypothetical protein n=1 Tax=Dactylosporangium sp. NPDC049742 TaxID=3154737 RepID=UPI00343D1116
MDPDRLEMVEEGVARFVALVQEHGGPAKEVLQREELKAPDGDPHPDLTAADRLTYQQVLAFVGLAQPGIEAIGVFVRDRTIDYIDADAETRTILLAPFDHTQR